MRRFLTDQNFRAEIVRGVRLRTSNADFVSTRETGLARTPDPDMLRWCVRERRTLLTHDSTTMPAHVRDLIEASEEVPTVICIRSEDIDIGRVVEDLVLLIECTTEGDYEGWFIYLPFR